MKKHKDIKDQLGFEQTVSETDKQLYELLFKELAEEDTVSIKSGFSLNVIQRIRIKQRKEAKRENLMFGLAITGVLLFSFLAIKAVTSFFEGSSFISFKILLPALSFGMLILVFQLTDNQLLKKKRINRQLKL